MNNEQPNYYSILTANVRYDRELKANEKLLFSEITALANKSGYCTATNNYFANLYGKSKTTISNWINHLKEKGYLKVYLEKDGSQIIGRKLYPVDEPVKENKDTPNKEKDNTPVKENLNTCTKKVKEGIKENFKPPIKEKFKENNTSINNININKEREIRDDQKTDYSLIVNELLNYYEFQSRKYRVDMPKITNHERILLTQVVRGKPLASLHKAVDKTLFGAIDYPIGYLIKCISNIEPNNVSIKEG